jgi:vacuolar-type H+-ATPase subunit F/Vma7
MSKIIVVGEENFTLGFELIGIEKRELSDLEKIIYSKTEDIGIVIIDESDYNNLSLKIKNKINSLLKPIIVVLSENDIKGDFLRKKIIKALGVDLLKNNN